MGSLVSPVARAHCCCDVCGEGMTYCAHTAQLRQPSGKHQSTLLTSAPSQRPAQARLAALQKSLRVKKALSKSA